MSHHFTGMLFTSLFFWFTEHSGVQVIGNRTKSRNALKLWGLSRLPFSYIVRWLWCTITICCERPCLLYVKILWQFILAFIQYNTFNLSSGQIQNLSWNALYIASAGLLYDLALKNETELDIAPIWLTVSLSNTIATANILSNSQ